MSEAEIVEAVIRRAGGAVHLIGHSFGGEGCLEVPLNLPDRTIEVEGTEIDVRVSRQRRKSDHWINEPVGSVAIGCADRQPVIVDTTLGHPTK